MLFRSFADIATLLVKMNQFNTALSKINKAIEKDPANKNFKKVLRQIKIRLFFDKTKKILTRTKLANRLMISKYKCRITHFFKTLKTRF